MILHLKWPGLVGVTGVTNLRKFLIEDMKLGRDGLRQLLEQASASWLAKEPVYAHAYDVENDKKGLPAYVGSGAAAYYDDPKRGKVPTYSSKVCNTSSTHLQGPMSAEVAFGAKKSSELPATHHLWQSWAS